MALRTAAAALAATILLVLPLPAAQAKPGKSAVREFTGTVASVSGTSFRLRRPGRAAVVVRLARKTKVAKGAKPRRGRTLRVQARRARKGWVARSVKLAPVADEGEDAVDEGEDPEDVPIEEDDAATEPGLDLEDTLGDLLGEGDEAEGEER